MIRTAKIAPLPCFGIERSSTEATCRACPHTGACAAAMGIRVNRISLDKAAFNFVPPSIETPLRFVAKQEKDFQAVYDITYFQIFGRHPGHSVNQFSNHVAKLAKKAMVSLRLFIMTNMLGHKQTWPEKEFTPHMLTDGRALHRVKVYATACEIKFGSLTNESLDNLTGFGTRHELRNRLLASEIRAGAWIVKYKLRNAGLPFVRMLAANELDLDPEWLAIEQYYEPSLMAHLARPSGTIDRIEHRHLVARCYARLKRHKHQAVGTFKTREEIMADAIVGVLSPLNYAPNDFEVRADPITDPLHMWNRLSQAIEHFECLKLTRGEPNVYNDTGHNTRCVVRVLKGSV